MVNQTPTQYLLNETKDILNKFLVEMYKHYNATATPPQFCMVLEGRDGGIFVTNYKGDLHWLIFDPEDPRNPYKKIDKFVIELYKLEVINKRAPNFWALHRAGLNAVCEHIETERDIYI